MPSLIDKPSPETVTVRTALAPIGVEPHAITDREWACYHRGVFIGRLYPAGDGYAAWVPLTVGPPTASLTVNERTPQLAALALLTRYYRKQRDAEATAKARQEE